MKSWTLELPAPAKINLFLRVTGWRADGLHELETRFQFLEIADTLRFEVLPHGIRRIDRHDFALPAEDLIVRAAKLLQAHCPRAAERGVAITLRKIIPPGSGLGGGSSNAATTLLALNHLWGLELSRERLAELAPRLGADVAVFVRGRAAHARGVGEMLTPFDSPERWLCVCLPPVQVSTAEVFARVKMEPRTDDDDDANADDGARNDLEPIAAALHPQVADALARLQRCGDARMSGSGGAVYAAFDSHAQAMHAAVSMPRELRARVTRSINRHPLLDFPRD
ncbi:MAG: 4-(cytidine 5'-diphospho)-2-C-methyl-D-erythritol kinase [bacterium]